MIVFNQIANCLAACCFAAAAGKECSAALLSLIAALQSCFACEVSVEITLQT